MIVVVDSVSSVDAGGNKSENGVGAAAKLLHNSWADGTSNVSCT